MGLLVCGFEGFLELRHVRAQFVRTQGWLIIICGTARSDRLWQLRVKS